MLKAICLENRSVDIEVDGQVVLNIDEVSDNETINLFLTPMHKDAKIMETEDREEYHKPWTHELLAQRV